MSLSQKSRNKRMKKVTKTMQECHISDPAEDLAKEIVLDNILDPTLLSKWPKPKMKVPSVFLHKTADFAQHCKKLLQMGINFYQPYLGTSYTRIICHTFDDHKTLLQYFEKNKLPYHTFGHPNKKKMRVIIRGLPKDADLDKFKGALKAAGIPIVRVHKMHMKAFAKDRDILVLAVVPYDDEGKKLLQLKNAFGHNIQLEPPNPKTRQCHRCQKWGHSQRYCHGDIKCVKCAGDHISAKCTRDKEKEPPTCANCGGNHTASYRECFYCPDSAVYKHNKRNKINKIVVGSPQKRILVTLENHEMLYKKIKNIPKHDEAVPF